ncbi:MULTISPECIES: 1,2-phenylacetyl-CoA epoxidase subunit PaaC [unclassified Janthinobacterium]|uniref:1,2-phenylacetyl-CoA epoxidase subunit PaaC n=1 Tax=unclassified Janthinobacterium TaxID=2610881 RepID=UPI0016165A82|nr:MULTISPECIES: 1,2-phenylacetyl-CoA epoxidase subunit PaaC [unclassified Janthinobacterium]MBB5368030.1 ring-1,2-phenylacetyl-CoA epoxidase subunit PaaC [Janthinobacterium sp. K2C7]MBB5379492.1 ring-1,2-phenylacetyl-CoA epoxidase subunit PaaC [Janthinobacterium sp. K2Li3]MBB5386412.1 ring-1,2-phenylacetyl-CoA epoxidase subunit PaaC [Janthinobacterium sp. K2E3]
MDDKVNYLLRLGDNALILSQQLSQLCGKGPALEEDMALTNVALDLLGQTRLWFSYAAELEGAGRDEDDIAFLRDAHDFKNCLLLEQPNGNYADTLMRQFFFDTWHYFQLAELLKCGDPRIVEVAQKSIKEVTYHLRRSGDLIVRLGDGTAESHAKTQAAADALWMYTGEMFNYDAVDQAMFDAGIAPSSAVLRAAFLEHVAEIFAEATLVMPAPDAWMQKGGKQGRHTEHLGFILAEMQFLQRAYPGAEW